MKEYKVIFADLDGTLIETISGETFQKAFGICVLDLKFLIKSRKSNLNAC